jgi:hypothetical protein
MNAITMAARVPFSAEDHALARSTIIAAMSATKTVRSRDDRGKICYREVADWAVRLPAALRVEEWVSGKALATNLVAHLTPGAPKTETDAWWEEQLADDESYRLLLEVTEQRRQAALRLKAGRAINVTATPGSADASKP